MSKEKIIRTWKDEAYRDGLSDEERDAIPDNPAGDRSDEDLEEVSGGRHTQVITYDIPCPNTYGQECATSKVWCDPD